MSLPSASATPEEKSVNKIIKNFSKVSRGAFGKITLKK
jgi:hypothetical protein